MGMSLYVQLLKAKGIVVTRENSSYIKVVENELAFCGYKAIWENGAQQPHSIAPSL